MPQFRFSFSIVLLLCFAGCSTKPAPAPSIGDAYVAPATLPIHSDLSPRSPVVATLKHGDHVEVLQIRRRFVRLRTPQGAEGWTDNRQLMTAGQMDELVRLKEAALKLPSQGRGTVYESLNIHTEPSRGSPSFYQIPENGSVEVVSRRVVQRLPFQSEVVAAPPPPVVRKPKKKSEDPKPNPNAFALPKPPAPKPPADWLELSRRNPLVEAPLEQSGKQEATTKPEPPPLKYDEWNLIRTKDGNAGWVLARMVNMAIPDSVAQYAEGNRITSYFSLGEVKDEDGNPQHHWLWTTLSKSLEAYDFDGFRVFIFNTRRNRFETAYVERGVKGYYPVEPRTVEVVEGRNRLKVQGFSLFVEDGDGRVWRRTFAFQGYRVRALSKEPAQKPVPGWMKPERDTSILGKAAQAPAQVQSFLGRAKQKIFGWFGK